MTRQRPEQPVLSWSSQQWPSCQTCSLLLYMQRKHLSSPLPCSVLPSPALARRSIPFHPLACGHKHCIILYHIVSYCIILYQIVSYCIILYHTVSYCIILYHIVSYCIHILQLFPPTVLELCDYICMYTKVYI